MNTTFYGRFVLGGLIIVNLMLLGSFLQRVGGGAAIAQPQPLRRAGDIMLVTGEVSGGNTGLVYMLDTTNGLLSAMSFDENRRSLQSMSAIDLNRIFEQAAGAPPRSRR
jgi:hypothetical protein